MANESLLGVRSVASENALPRVPPLQPSVTTDFRSRTFHIDERGLHEHAHRLAISEAAGSLDLLARAGVLDVLSEQDEYVHRLPTMTELTSAEVLEDGRAISALEAFMHVLKSNLGPGCLALPIVFARAGPLVSAGLLLGVALQGTYSMVLLVRLKHAVRACGQRCVTLEDLAHLAFGAPGLRAVESLIVAQQLGVCCVFISLVRTNLIAGLRGLLGAEVCFALVVGACALLALARKIQALWPLSMAANAFMLTACATAVGASVGALLGAPDAPELVRAPSVHAAGACLSALFFAYEGVALVLPVESAYAPTVHSVAPLHAAVAPLGAAPHLAGPEPLRGGGGVASRRGSRDSAGGGALSRADTPSALPLARSPFEAILVGAMGCIGVLFATVGISAASGFPEISSGSITAYLAGRWPDNRWFAAVNALVGVAVLCTYPLQLQPAVMVLDKLGARPGGGRLALGARFVATRWAVTAACALVVLTVPRLDLLIQLLGALCQAALAGLPFGLSLQLRAIGLVPISATLAAVHTVLMLVCACVMVGGTAAAGADIARYLAASHGS